MQSGPYAAPGSAPPRIGDWLSESFNLFGRDWGAWLVQGLIVSIVSVVVPVGVIIAAFATGIAGALVLTSNSNVNPAFPITTIGALIAVGLGVCVVLSFFLTAGMMRTAARQLRGEPISVGDLFSGGSRVLPMIGAAILALMGVAAASLCFCLPGLYLAARWHYVPALILEGGCGVGEAFQRSWEATAQHSLLHLVWILLVAAIQSAGGVVPLLGSAVTIPVSVLMSMISYRDTIGMAGAVPPPPRQYAGVPPGYSPYTPAAVPCARCDRPIAADAVQCPFCGNIRS